MMSSWTYYQSGRTVPGAPLVVRKRLKEGERQKDVVYECRRKCCGEIVELTHRQIAKMVAEKAPRCRACTMVRMIAANKARSNPTQVRGVLEKLEYLNKSVPTFPQWPVPGA